MRIDHHVGLARQRGVHHVADGQRARALVPAAVQRGQRVRGLARLRDGYHQAARVERGVAVAELAAVVDVGAQPGQFFQQEFPDQAGVPRGAARDQRGAADAVQERELRVEFAQRHVARLLQQPAAHRVDDGLRLFVDFLEQKVLVAVFLRGERVPVDVPRGAADRLAGEVGNRHSVRVEFGHFAVFQEHHLAGVVQQRGNVGRHEVFVGSDADDDRRGVLGRQQGAGRPFAQRDDRERAGQAVDGGAYRGGEGRAGLQGGVDQVRNHLGVGLGRERPAFARQLVAQVEIVFDDAVMDHDHVAGPVGMGIFLGRRAVRRPSRVADADRARQGIGL